MLLITLVIYNPFAALSGSSGHLSYEKLASNRASVGSSELQHFSPVPYPEVQNHAKVDLQRAEPAKCVQEQQLSGDQRELILTEPALLAGVWFRPPPSR